LAGNEHLTRWTARSSEFQLRRSKSSVFFVGLYDLKRVKEGGGKEERADNSWHTLKKPHRDERERTVMEEDGISLQKGTRNKKKK